MNGKIAVATARALHVHVYLYYCPFHLRENWGPVGSFSKSIFRYLGIVKRKRDQGS